MGVKILKPSSWDRFKLLLWKNLRTHSRRKKQTCFELLTPLFMGFLFLLLRGLQPAPGPAPIRLYSSFSPEYLPEGKLPDVDRLVNSSRFVNKKNIISEGLCEIIKRGEFEPNNFSLKTLLNYTKKLDNLDPDQLDFKKPDFIDWLNDFDLPTILKNISKSAKNEDVKEVLSWLIDEDDNGTETQQEEIVETITDFLQESRSDIVKKLKEIKNKTSSNESNPKRWLVLWSPANKILSSIMEDASLKTPFIGCGVDNASFLLHSLTRPLPFNQDKFVLAAVVFPDNLQNATELPADLPVVLRFPGLARYSYDAEQNRDVDDSTSIKRTNWDTTYVYPKNPLPGVRNPKESTGGSPGYWREGFLGLQSSISSAVMSYYNKSVGGNIPSFQIRLQRFPEPATFDDPNSAVLLTLILMGLNLAFIYLVMTTTREITSEKESQLKESLKILGVKSWLHWAAWFVPVFLSFLFGSACLTFIFKFPVEYLKILPASDGLYVFALFAVYSLCSVFTCFFITACFSTASAAAAGSAMIWLSLSLVYGWCELAALRVPYQRRILVSLLPNCALNYAIKTIMALESTGSGLNWNTLNYTIPDSDDVAVGTLMQMLLGEAMILLIATLYLEAIYPGKSGIPVPWYFPFTRKFWFGTKPEAYVEVGTNQSDVVLETEPRHLPVGVQIRNLRKVYNNGKVAVNGLTLNMFEGQITVLLGHNGAGKTTTMSMLTGLSAPTSGSALIAGADLISNMKGVRENLGICPQGNILIDDLTVREHLYLFCKLKGLTNSAVSSETMKYIRMLQLEPKADTLSKNLSGGMKRKLAAAVALCGGSKVVLFDEPSSGMDPAARRSLWDLLQSEKVGRTILLTTHFMDEADLLGDRIAIMTEGRLRAAGSSFFLKKNYGGGYTLALVKDPGCVTDQVTSFMQQFFDGIQPASDVGSELTYHLSDHSSSQFQTVFGSLQKLQKSLKINSFGVTTATIEDVFMNIVTNTRRHLPQKSEPQVEEDEYQNSDTCVSLGIVPLLTGYSLFLRQLWALFTKHILLMSRSPIGYLIALIGPACYAVLTIKTASSWQGTNDLPPRIITFKDYALGYGSILGNTHNLTFEKTFAGIIKSEGGDMIQLDNSLSPSDAVLKLFGEKPLSARTNFITGISQNGSRITAMFNNEAFHTAPLALQLIYNSFLQSYVNESVGIRFINHPLPYTGIMKTVIQQKGINVSFNLAYQGALVFSVLVAWLIMSAVREKSSGSKLLQLMAGVNPTLYWTVAFIWNFIISAIPAVLFTTVIYLYQEEGFATVEDAGKLIFVLFTFLIAALPLSFLCSLFLEVPASSFMALFVGSYVLGPMAFTFLCIVRFNKITSQSVLDWWVNLMTWSPPFAIGESMQNLNRFYWLREFCEPIYEKYCSLDTIKHVCCREESHCPEEGCLFWTNNFLDIESPGIGSGSRACLFMAAFAIIALLVFELRLNYKIRAIFSRSTVNSEHFKSPDVDVAREWQIVRTIKPEARRDLNLLVKELSKKYDNFQAVKSLSLMIPPGECFGLLGVNGAGKTTSFKMLTGDLDPTSGDAFVQGFSIRNNRKQVHQLVGYCPQFDALLDELTGRETMRMFCYMRGVPDAEVELTCEKLARELLFYPHIDHKVGEYSGGNKRKLSTAVALIGDPPVVYLDEPTTGMDPVAKRYFWDVICKVRSTGKTIILTSHSMEECEALCTRVGIMVRGELLCLGSPQYLKTKFAQGYSLTVKTCQGSPTGQQRRRSPASELSVCQYIHEKLPGAALKEEHEGVMTFHIPTNGSLSWASMFGTLENARKEKRIEDYYLGQTSLEEVFLSFASACPKTE